MRIIIVGGVAGGMSAATRLRRLSEKNEIIVLEKGPFVSFANCGLPYYLGGEIQDWHQLVLKTPEQLFQRFNLDIRVEHEVTGLNLANQEVTVKSVAGTEKMHYDRLLLSPGASPIVPKLAGVDLNRNDQFVLRGIPDLQKITAALKNQKSKKVAIIGAGAIGIEIAEALLKQGLQVSLIEAQDQLLLQLDLEMTTPLAQKLVGQGLHLYLAAQAQKITPDNQLELTNGQTVASDVIIFALGVRPATQLFTAAGLATAADGSLIVDEQYQTSAAKVYAVGDAILTKNQLTNQLQPFRLASPANRQGRQVADTIMGIKRKNQGNLGTSIVRVFDLAAAQTGLNEKQLQKLRIAYRCLHLRGNSHVTYFPGAQEISLKLLFDPKDGRLFGAQAVGGQGTARRIDVLTTAIKAGLTVADLPELELSYSPPFGSAKDPVNLIGYAAQNIVEKLSENVQWYQLAKLQKNGALLLDVREPAEIKAEGTYPQAENIPLEHLRASLDHLPTDRLIITACRSGQRSYLAERILRNHGFQVKNLDGGWLIYHAGITAWRKDF
jgi:NADPH-dependent 2,4-dienoyl-CoA reductase/sulfur reductase-like enzyme/rhodanese-related sulfurtransferase